MKRRFGISIVSALVFAGATGAEGEPAAGAKLERVVFVGDSITVGVGISVNRESDRYSSVATRLLKEKHPAVTEINCGASGGSLSGGADGDYQADAILKHNPDAVVIQWGVNDHFWGASVPRFAAVYDSLLLHLRRARRNMPIVVMTLVPDYRWPDNGDEWIGAANVAIQDIAARYGCHVADVHRAFNHERALTYDQIHPNKRGADIMGRAVAEAFAAPPLSKEKLAVQFDQGVEVRFQSYVFNPKWDKTPAWIRVFEISRAGMQIDTPVSLAIRTAAVYPPGTTWKIVVRAPDGKPLESLTRTVDYSRMLNFMVDPKNGLGKFVVEITEAE